MEDSELPRVYINKRAPSLSTHLFKGAAGVAISRLLSIGAGFVTSILLARFLGISGFGEYNYILSWVLLLSTVIGDSFDRLIMRQGSVCHTHGEWSIFAGLIRWLSRKSLLLFVTAAVTGGMIWQIFIPSSLSNIRYYYCIVLITALFRIITSLCQSTLRGLQQVSISFIPSGIVEPFLGLAGIILLYNIQHKQFSVLYSLALLGGSAAAAGVTALTMLVKRLPNKAKPSRDILAGMSVEYKNWSSTISILLMVTGVSVINDQTATQMLGVMKGAVAVSVFAAADKGAAVIAFPLAAANMALAPIFASLFASRQQNRLQRLVTKSTRLILFSATILAILLITLRQPFLSIFGSGFQAAQSALIIICLGQWINVACGSVGFLLLMTGHERDVAKGVGIAAATNILLNLFLIPHWGVNGSAIAAAISTTIWNFVLMYFVWIRLGIATTALGPLIKKDQSLC